jgi:hypothetical protein
MRSRNCAYYLCFFQSENNRDLFIVGPRGILQIYYCYIGGGTNAVIERGLVTLLPRGYGQGLAVTLSLRACYTRDSFQRVEIGITNAQYGETCVAPAFKALRNPQRRADQCALVDIFVRDSG